MTAELPPTPSDLALVVLPAVAGVAVGVLLTSILLFVAGRFDPTQGVLTLSIMITLGMLGATAYCLIFTIPNDDITPGVVGALSAGFGAVVAHWLGRAQNVGGSPSNDHREPPKSE
jgi:uncharacterized RDD family membrane protein YckC